MLRYGVVMKDIFFSGSYANNLDDAHSSVSFLEHLSNAEKENVKKKMFIEFSDVFNWLKSGLNNLMSRSV